MDLMFKIITLFNILLLLLLLSVYIFYTNKIKEKLGNAEKHIRENRKDIESILNDKR